MHSRQSCKVQNNNAILAQTNIFLFSEERCYHAAVVVDGKDQIILLGGVGSSSQTTGEIVKSE